jgi:hypothetical protein
MSPGRRRRRRRGAQAPRGARVVGYDLGQRDGSSADSSSAVSLPNGFGTTSDPSASSGSSHCGHARRPLADQVDDSVVSEHPFTGGQAAGTGIIISSTGLVLSTTM